MGEEREREVYYQIWEDLRQLWHSARQHLIHSVNPSLTLRSAVWPSATQSRQLNCFSQLEGPGKGAELCHGIRLVCRQPLRKILVDELRNIRDNCFIKTYFRNQCVVASFQWAVFITCTVTMTTRVSKEWTINPRGLGLYRCGFDCLLFNLLSGYVHWVRSLPGISVSSFVWWHD